ncbi:VOC family protein [Alkalibacillus aidingensis]|uniref:VOC family protein n=1 Tax=Alkalibacillus aidingensis TaxID=2747607 RepID=UPI00166082B5|nr:VOC family protein [Alkalibacillus aidingensis]
MNNFHTKPTTYVDHVKIKVSDLQRSLRFYQEVIGFQILETTDTSAKLTADGKTTLLTIEQPENVKPKQRRTTGLYHFAILLPNRSDLANILTHFIDHNIQIGASDHLVSEAIYLSDPDGNGIEVYIDRDPSEWEWNNGEVAMTVDPLNFRGVLSSKKENELWQGLPPETVMGHIHLHVSDLEKTEEFYSKGLGFDVVCRFGSQALFISSNQYHHHIGLNTWNGVGAPSPSKNSVGLDHFSIVLPSHESRIEVVANLEKVGASVREENEGLITTDPSGNDIYLKV